MKWRYARNSHQEQAFFSVPKVKKQTDVKSLNSLKVSPATGAKNSLSVAVKSIPPNTEKWLRKRYDQNDNNNMSNETKRETNYSMNNK